MRTPDGAVVSTQEDVAHQREAGVYTFVVADAEARDVVEAVLADGRLTATEIDELTALSRQTSADGTARLTISYEFVAFGLPGQPAGLDAAHAAPGASCSMPLLDQDAARIDASTLAATTLDPMVGRQPPRIEQVDLSAPVERPTVVAVPARGTVTRTTMDPPPAPAAEPPVERTPSPVVVAVLTGDATGLDVSAADLAAAAGILASVGTLGLVARGRPYRVR